MLSVKTNKIYLLILAPICFSGLIRADETGVVNRDRVKVAAVQINGYDKGDLPREGYQPAKSLVPYIDRAGRDEAQLIVFPEYILGRIRVPGPETKMISEAAESNKIYVIVGCWELLDNKRFANVALLFGRDGKIVGKYSKTHPAIDHFDETAPPWQRPPTGKSREWMIENDPEWIMEAGATLPVFDLDFGKIGIMTCYDGWFPETPRILSLKGAELIVWINGRGGSIEDFIVRSTLFQSHVAMIATNQAYGSGTTIADCSKRHGNVLALCPDKQESYITGTIALDRVRAIRHRSRNFRQRRPDLYGPLTETNLPRR